MITSPSRINHGSPPTVASGKLLGFDLSGRRAIVYGAETSLGGAVIDADRSNQPAPEAGGDQNVVDHVADRGLAVGAGDADQA